MQHCGVSCESTKDFVNRRNPSETHRKPETHQKPVGNLAGNPETRRKLVGNPSETLTWALKSGPFEVPPSENPSETFGGPILAGFGMAQPHNI